MRKYVNVIMERLMHKYDNLEMCKWKG